MANTDTGHATVARVADIELGSEFVSLT